MIEELTIKGYRSLKDVTWRPGKLNVLIGPNAGGKSNLLRALGLLREINEGRVDDMIAQDGGLQSMMWDGTADRLSFRLATRGRLQGDSEEPTSLAYQLSYTPIIASNQLKITTEILSRQDPRGAEILFDRDVEINRQPNQLAALLDRAKGTKTMLARRPTTSPTELALSVAISRWAIHHSMAVDKHSEIRKAPIAQRATQVADDGQNLVAVLHTLYAGNETFRTDVDDGMRAAFGDEYRELAITPAAADQRVQLRLRWMSLSRLQSAADLSDGTLRFLLLLAILANPDPPPLIAIDEPEAGLHPGMLPIVVDFARQAAMRSQVVFSTHSSQLLDAFTDEPPVTTVVRSEAGATTLRNVDGEELRRWLKEFSLGALYRSRELESLE